MGEPENKIRSITEAKKARCELIQWNAAQTSLIHYLISKGFLASELDWKPSGAADRFEHYVQKEMAILSGADTSLEEDVTIGTLLKEIVKEVWKVIK